MKKSAPTIRWGPTGTQVLHGQGFVETFLVAASCVSFRALLGGGLRAALAGPVRLRVRLAPLLAGGVPGLWLLGRELIRVFAGAVVAEVGQSVLGTLVASELE